MPITTPINAARFNQAAGSTAVDDIALFPGSRPFNDDGSWTIEAFVSTTDGDAEFNRIVRLPVGGQQTYSLLIKDGQAHVRFDPGGVVQAGPNIADGNLHHIAGVFDDEADLLILYVDGVEVGRSVETGTPVQGTEGIFFGGTNVANQFFRGEIAEVRIWDEARSPREIVENAGGVIFDEVNEPSLQQLLTFQQAGADNVTFTLDTQTGDLISSAPLDPANGFIVDPGETLALGEVSVDFSDTPDVQVQLTSPAGTFTVIDNLALVTVVGDGTGTLIVSGPEADVNFVLASLEFTADPGFAGDAEITIDAADTTNGGNEQAVIELYVAPVAEAESLVVTTLDDVVDALDGETSLREALELANAGDALGDGIRDRITFDSSILGGEIQLTKGQLTITDDVIIAGRVTLDGRDSGRVLEIVQGEVGLRNLTIEDGDVAFGESGTGNEGGGIRIAEGADVTLNDVTVRSSNATVGGGVFNDGRLSIYGGAFYLNSAFDSGGGIASNGTLTIEDATIRDNTASYNGGGLNTRGAFSIHQTLIHDNQVVTYTGGSVSYGGGGINLGSGANGSITNSLISENEGRYTAGAGGLAVQNGAQAELVNTTLFGNYSSYGSGSISNDGDLALTHVTVAGQRGEATTAVENYAALTVTNSILFGTSPTSSQINPGTPTLTEIGGNIIDGFFTDGLSGNTVTGLTEADVFALVNGGGDALLTENGGPFDSVLPDATGLAIDTGGFVLILDEFDVDRDGDTNEQLPEDARGQLRQTGDRPDLGAVEIDQPGDDDDIVFTTAANRTATGEVGNDTLFGSSDGDALFGGNGDDSLFGGADGDELVGGDGADLMDGGDGDDTASYFDSTQRVQADLANIIRGVNDSEGDVFVDVENLIGSNRNDSLRGDNGDNALFGGAASDRLFGRAGDDSLSGELGFDVLYGNAGADRMRGGDGGDRYVYFQLSDSRVGAANRDVIVDFVSGEDRIEISRLDANVNQGGNQVFDFIGGATFSGTAGELRFFQSAGKNHTIVQADIDGDSAQDFQIELSGLLTLDAGDFVL